MRNRRNNNIKNIKDYLVPIITFLLIFVLIYVAFSGGENQTDTDNQIKTLESNGIPLLLSGGDTSGVIISTQNKNRDLLSGESLELGETLMLKTGDLAFTYAGNSYRLDKNGELIYTKNGKISLESSSLWVNSRSSTDIDMKFGSIMVGANSVVNIEQNEVESNVYLLSGTAEVKNLAGVSTFLSPGKKVKISNQEASNESLDLSLSKQDFDDYFKISDWYLKNDGATSFLENNGGADEDSLTGSVDTTGSGELIKKVSNIAYASLLSFDSVYDEGNVTTASTTISGKFADSSIMKIIIGGKQAIINSENRTFNAVGVDTSKKSNDIVIKVLDGEDNAIGKYVYTLYYTAGAQTSDTPSSDFASINTSSYPVNDEDFLISIPTVKEGVSYSDENTFFGTVKNPDVASVLVNGYKLKTYNGSTFRYHAYKRFKTLGEGVNNYEVKYLGKDGSVILKKYVTINKKTNALEAVSVELISNEAEVKIEE